MDLISSFELLNEYSLEFEVIQFSNIPENLQTESPLEPSYTIEQQQPQNLLSNNELQYIQNMPQRPRMKRNVWSYEEDLLLGQLAIEFNYNWAKIVKYFPNKTNDSIIRRWKTRHDPTIKKSKWTKDEDQTILHAYIELGGNWKKIAERLPGRPADIVKNRFYGSLKKKHLPLIQDAKKQINQWRENQLKKDVDEQALDDLICEFDEFQKDIDTSPADLEGQLEDPELRQKKIDELYRQMSALESYLSMTKEQLDVLTKEAKEKRDSILS